VETLAGTGRWPLWNDPLPAHCPYAAVPPLTLTAAHPPLGIATLPAALVADLRTDHAGETGAVMIYRGVLAGSRDAAVRRFAMAHGATEAEHLAAIEQWLPPAQRSRLLPLWRLAGWLTGWLPSLFGARAVYATIQAVETFVDRHYAEQLAAIDACDPTRSNASLQALRALLQACQADELAHRDEAADLLGPAPRPGWAGRGWAALVGSGSQVAVRISRWV